MSCVAAVWLVCCCKCAALLADAVGAVRCLPLLPVCMVGCAVWHASALPMCLGVWQAAGLHLSMAAGVLGAGVSVYVDVLRGWLFLNGVE